MIAKKNSGANLENKRSAFFTLGLLVTGSLTLAAFTYSDPMLKADSGMEVKREPIAMTFELDTPKEKPNDIAVPPTEVPKVNQTATVDIQATVGELVSLAKNTNNINTGVTIDLGGMPTGPTNQKGTKIEPVTNEVFDIVDLEASFVGGVVEMMKYVQSNVNYPEMSIEAREEGKVFVTFIVEKDGSISNIEVVRGVSKALDREAKRVVQSFPNWIPGEKNMQKVRTRVSLPIVFTLK